MKIATLTVTLLLHLLCRLDAQEIPCPNRFYGTFGPSWLLNAKASGPAIGIGYARNIGAKGLLHIEAGHALAQSAEGIAPYLGNRDLIFRDFQNPRPRFESLFAWGEDDFPGIRLKSQPNRYFALTGGVFYTHQIAEFKALRLLGGVGGMFAFRDEAEILKTLHVLELDYIINSLDNVYLPVIQYRTYWDIAVAPRFGLEYAFKNRIVMALQTQLSVYPASGDWWLSTCFNVGFKF